MVKRYREYPIRTSQAKKRLVKKTKRSINATIKKLQKLNSRINTRTNKKKVQTISKRAARIEQNLRNLL